MSICILPQAQFFGEPGLEHYYTHYGEQNSHNQNVS